MRLRHVALGLLVLAAGCVGASATDVRSPVQQRSPNERPQLVVVAVFDQLGAATLERLMPLLDADGAIRSVAARGNLQRVAYRTPQRTPRRDMRRFTPASPRARAGSWRMSAGIPSAARYLGWTTPARR